MQALRDLHHARIQAFRAGAAFSAPKCGLVMDFHPILYAVKVSIQPEDIETGWCPIVTLMAGQGFGAYLGPSQGDQAVLIFQEGDREAGICIGFLPSDQDKPPTVQSGELHLIAKTGQFVKMLADGAIDAQADANTTLTLTPGGTITSKGAWTHTGTLHVTADVTVDTKVTATNDVIGGGKHLATHTHGGVQTGGGNTAAPN